MNSQHPLRVLIVDDTPIMRVSLCQALNSAAANIEVPAMLASGEEALSYLEGHADQIDALLIDLRMPGLGGIETVRRIVPLYPDMKIVMMSAYGDQTLIDQALEAGAGAYIIKGSPLHDVIIALQD